MGQERQEDEPLRPKVKVIADNVLYISTFVETLRQHRPTEIFDYEPNNPESLSQYYVDSRDADTFVFFVPKPSDLDSFYSQFDTFMKKAQSSEKPIKVFLVYTAPFAELESLPNWKPDKDSSTTNSVEIQLVGNDNLDHILSIF